MSVRIWLQAQDNLRRIEQQDRRRHAVMFALLVLSACAIAAVISCLELA